MSSKYAQLEQLHNDYRNHPASGLKQCEKRLARDPGNVVYNLAYARFLQDLHRDNEVLGRLENLPKHLVSKADPELVSGIQETYANSRQAIEQKISRIGGQFLSDIWTGAIDGLSKQQKKPYYQHMYRASIRDGFWDIAQQLFNRLQKEDPTNAHYHFMWIAFTHLRAQACAVEDVKNRDTFQNLAFRSLEVAVANTLKRKDTPRTIHSSQALELLQQVYRSQSKFEELLEVLNNPVIGIDSELIKGDAAWRRLKWDALQGSGNCEALYDSCFSLLNALLEAIDPATGAIPLDLVWVYDMSSWTYLVDAAMVEDFPRSDQIAVWTLIEKFLEKCPSSRNAACAALYYKSLIDEDDSPVPRIQFFRRQCSSPSCYDDIRGYLLDLDEDGQQSFLQSARQWLSEGGTEASEKSFDDWIISEINLLKITYMLNISKADDPRADDIVEFTRDCLRLFQFCHDHNIASGNEAAMLAAVALFRLTPDGPIGSLRRDGNLIMPSDLDKLFPPKLSLVQAAVILEYLNEIGSFDYSILLLSLRTYLLLGLGSLAMKCLHRLKLKEVQNESAKHLFYTRISTIHPFEARDKQSKDLPEHIKDPLLGCMDIQPWYDRAFRQLRDEISDDFDDVPIAKIFEYVGVKDRLDRSMVRAMYQIEQRRMARLRDQSTYLGPSPHFYPDMKDSRDFDALPNFEHALSPSFNELSSAGPLPSNFWLAVSIDADLVQTVIHSKTYPTDSQLDLADTCLEAEDELEDEQRSKLTFYEDVCLVQEWHALGMLVWDLVAPSNVPIRHEPEGFQEIYDHMQKIANVPFQIEPLIGLPMWTNLHWLFLELELLKAWVQVCDVWVSALRKQGKGSRLPKKPSIDQINSLKKDVIKKANAMQDVVRGWRRRLEKTGTEEVLEMIQKDSNLELVMGAERLKRYAISMRDSAVDALNGVIRVKVG